MPPPPQLYWKCGKLAARRCMQACPKVLAGGAGCSPVPLSISSRRTLGFIGRIVSCITANYLNGLTKAITAPFSLRRASFSFDAIEAISAAWLLPVMALFIPIHVGTALALLMIMTINAVFNHAGWEVYPDKWIKGWWGEHIITASHHNLHHTKFKGNYGLYFRFWDKLCGTDTGLV